MPDVPAQTPPLVTVPVNPNVLLVTNFDGWGTSLCWWANKVGGYSNRDTYASLAFTTLKLNIVRYNIGGGENPAIANTLSPRARVPGFEPVDGQWDWNADLNQRWMLRRAVALGANRVVAFANSPPWWMTVSGSVTGSTNGTGDNLQTRYEQAFADYLATVVSHLTALDGVKFDFVTPMNEPTSSWWVYGGKQEGCHIGPIQQARLVNDLRSALDIRHLAAGIDASEDNDERSAVRSLKSYGSAQTNVSLIASHSYSANAPAGLHDLATGLRQPAWISEYGDGDSSGLKMARRIHDDITGARVQAWVYWQFTDSGPGWGFLGSRLDSTDDTTYTIHKKFYVMGQFSEYIRPGCQILKVDDGNSLAAYDPTNHSLVIVAVNTTTNDLRVDYNLSTFAKTPETVSAVRTSPVENLAALPAVPVLNRNFSTTLIPRSVTTFILKDTVR